MDDLTTLHVKKRMTSRHEITLQEKNELSNELEFRLTDIYINSKAKRQTTIEKNLSIQII
jgi:hypothetical protein